LPKWVRQDAPFQQLPYLAKPTYLMISRKGWTMKNDLLRRIRASKFTLKELSQRIGISEGQLSKIETGKREARVEELEAMARELGVSPAIFFDDDPNSSSSAFTAGANSETIQPFDHVVGVPVMGEACSKRWVEEGEGGAPAAPFATIPAVPGRHHPHGQFAFKVTGASMSGRDIHHDEYVICVSYFEARDNVLPGDIVIIERRRGGLVEVSCRETSVAQNRIEFHSRPNGQVEPPIVSDKDLVENEGQPLKIIGLVIGKYKPLFD
jgi:transcriptional regulator with XRE-family HTH domain